MAELFAIKALAFLVVSLIVYLYWSGVKEKRAQRREREWLENRRRELKAKAANRSEDE
jgi:hypothetical protein